MRVAAYIREGFLTSSQNDTAINDQEGEWVIIAIKQRGKILKSSRILSLHDNEFNWIEQDKTDESLEKYKKSLIGEVDTEEVAK